jgi:D-sedoheptulose 7-phosphate isomerase
MLNSRNQRHIAVKSLQASAGVMLQLSRDAETMRLVCEVASSMVRAYRGGGKLVIFGNGGSAADAQHIAAEMVGRFLLERDALPALALATNTSSLTAIANDYSFADVFCRQVDAFVTPGDVVIAISTSGESENVIRACWAARRRAATTVGLTGEAGGGLAVAVDHCQRVPASSTARVQEGHIAIGHILCEIVESELFAVDDASPRTASRQCPTADAPAVAPTMEPLAGGG